MSNLAGWMAGKFLNGCIIIHHLRQHDLHTNEEIKQHIQKIQEGKNRGRKIRG